MSDYGTPQVLIDLLRRVEMMETASIVTDAVKHIVLKQDVFVNIYAEQNMTYVVYIQKVQDGDVFLLEKLNYFYMKSDMLLEIVTEKVNKYLEKSIT